MVVSCSAWGCRNRRTVENVSRGITFHRFPTMKKKQWEVALRRKGFSATSASVLCSAHFKPQDFDRCGQIVRLREGTIPSVFSFPTPLQTAVKSKTTPTSRKAEESLSVNGPQRSQETKTHIVDHSYVLSLSEWHSQETENAPQHSQETENGPQHSQETENGSQHSPTPTALYFTWGCQNNSYVLSLSEWHSQETENGPQHSQETENGPQHSQETKTHPHESSRKAEESLSVNGPQRSKQTKTHNVDHFYALPDSLDGLKAKLREAMARVETLKRELRNAKIREQCAKKKMCRRWPACQSRAMSTQRTRERLPSLSSSMVQKLTTT